MRLTNNFSIENNDMLSFIIDNFDGPCYMTDMDTNELLFVNKNIEQLVGSDAAALCGRKCYEVLQNKTAPCSFCTNKFLKENEPYKWEFYNEYLNKYFDIKDMLLMHEGRKIRVEIATDITALKEKYFELENKTAVEELLVQCAGTFCKGDTIDYAIDKILGMVGKYYNANRAYLFKIDELEQYATKSYEWCADGVELQIDKLPLAVISDIMEDLVSNGICTVDCIDESFDGNSINYKILYVQGIRSFLAVSLYDKEKTIGFIGVDDPRINTKNIQLLQTISMFVSDDLNKMRTAEKLEFLSTRDSLTGLYNRNYYDSTLKELRRSRIDCVGIVSVDINGLKIINEKYGHSFGDRYIINCADILKEHFKDKVFRIGGDEFIIFLQHTKYLEFNKHILTLEEKLKKNTQVSMSIGVSWCENIEDIDKHLKAADALMIKNKNNHYRNIEDCIKGIYNESEEALLDEIKKNQFEILLQPKLSIDTMKIIGAEALIRKKDEAGKYIPPYLFVSRYESQGTIYLIDLFVLRQVCEFLADMRKEGFEELPHISVNFSRVTLLVTDIQGRAIEICDEYGIDCSMITIEVTEDCGFVESAAIGHAIGRLKEVGFKISLDDFGCKYSNIEIVSSISFDEVKIDKSLLYSNHMSKHIILGHIIEMFQSFPDIAVVVEGIEEEEHLNLLNDYKGLIGQGYLFSKPVSKELFIEQYKETL
ncbi:MAG: EAL domain-containing protein [Lachnospiraceae bacterium]